MAPLLFIVWMYFLKIFLLFIFFHCRLHGFAWLGLPFVCLDYCIQDGFKCILVLLFILKGHKIVGLNRFFYALDVVADEMSVVFEILQLAEGNLIPLAKADHLVEEYLIGHNWRLSIHLRQIAVQSFVKDIGQVTVVIEQIFWKIGLVDLVALPLLPCSLKVFPLSLESLFSQPGEPFLDKWDFL